MFIWRFFPGFSYDWVWFNTIFLVGSTVSVVSFSLFECVFLASGVSWLMITGWIDSTLMPFSSLSSISCFLIFTLDSSSSGLL